MAKDLYQILGVQKAASADEIRSAYRRKAKSLHPDLHPDDAEKMSEFKAVSAAFEILGDEDKRARYDNGLINDKGEPIAQNDPFAGFSSTSGFQGDPFEDIISGMFGAGRRRPGPRKGTDMRYRVEISFEDAVNGAKRDMAMADGRTLSVTIPPGLESGKTLRLKSQGQPSRSGGPPGDALLEVSVRDSAIWTRDGNALRMSVQVPLKTAILGGVIDVPTPTGSVSLKIPEGSDTGAVLRLRDKGVQTPGNKGHLYARLEIMIGDTKDPELKAWARGKS